MFLRNRLRATLPAFETGWTKAFGQKETGMNRIALAATIAALGSAASAQQANFSYVGEVISIEDPLGVFTSTSVGEEAAGIFAFDANGASFADLPNSLSAFFGLSLSASVGNENYISRDSDIILVLVTNDFNSIQNSNDSDELVDGLSLGSAIEPLEGTTAGSVNAFFEGETSWFQGTNLPDPTTFGMGNLIRAEVVIEFQLTIDETTTMSSATIRINSVSNDNGTIATIGCQALQFAPPVAQGDFFDVTAFISSFSANDARADLAAPAGVFNFADISAFLGQYNSDCSN
jgi:hypothetical protein